MASFSQNILQVDFESIRILEVPSMLETFRSLEAIGLKRFLGGASSVHEEEVRGFFEMTKVVDDSIQCTMKGTEISISEQVFAQFFKHPTKGLTTFEEILVVTIA